MRIVPVIAIAVALSLGGSVRPALAAGPTLTLGSYLGVERYSHESQAVYYLSTSPPGLVVAPEPGLRLGMVLPGEKVELAAAIGADVIGSTGESFHSLGLTLEGQYFLPGWASEVNPYVGAHLGISNLGSDGYSESFTRYGLQAGVRRIVAEGHGDVRLEVRGGMIQGPHDEGLSEIGVRLGYNLWFR